MQPSVRPAALKPSNGQTAVPARASRCAFSSHNKALQKYSSIPILFHNIYSVKFKPKTKTGGQ
jgi:hypothetical protein